MAALSMARTDHPLCAISLQSSNHADRHLLRYLPSSMASAHRGEIPLTDALDLPVRGHQSEYLNGGSGERYVRRVSVRFIRTDHSDLTAVCTRGWAEGDADRTSHGEDDFPAGASGFVAAVALDNLLEG